MDAIELLQHDHRMVEQLFRDYRAAASADQRRGVVEVMIRELSKHAALEETLFYPVAGRVAEGRDVDEQLAGHMTVKKLLAKLDKEPAGDGTEAVMAELEEAVSYHVRSEEDDLMPKVREALDERALTELGAEIDARKQRAPTRPHPHVPDRPPALTLLAPVAAVYDRFRDRVHGRPRT